MAWKAEYSGQAIKELKKLGKPTAARIDAYRHDRVLTAESPRSLGQALAGDLKGFWRYHVGDFRVICDIQDDRLVALVVRLGNRRDVYQ